MLMVSSGWQRAAFIRDEQVDTSATSRFSMLLVSYNCQPEGGKNTFSGSLIFNRNATSLLQLTTLGPSVNYSRKILDERGTLTSGLSYSTVWSDAAAAGGGILQLQIGGGMTINKQQSVNLASALFNVASGNGRQPNFFRLSSPSKLNCQIFVFESCEGKIHSLH